MTSNALVLFKPKQRRRFYEPIVLFKALTDITHEEGSLGLPETPARPRTEEQRFHQFVHKLAGVCDSTRGGKTVTSFAVLEHEDRFVYVFGCNQVCSLDLVKTQKFVTELLDTLSGFHQLDEAARGPVRRAVLEMILAFNMPRLDIYLKSFKGQLKECLEYCERQTDQIATAVGAGLKVLGDAIADIAFKGLDESEYLPSYNRFLQALDVFLTPQTKAFVDERALRGRIRDGRSFECWSELRHNLSRLRNYQAVVQDLIDAEKEWPELFQEVEVIPVSSSKADPNPLGRKSEVADAIIGRMEHDNSRRERYRGFALELQGMQFDDRIQKQCQRDSFKPFVHSEILVLEWVKANASRLELSFFHGWKYIGSSKGACRLCHYYFETPGQHGGIKTRSSHGNLYVNWRFPDLYENDGPEGKARRQEVFNWMMNRVRDDAFQTMESKASTGKRHDSSTHPLMSVRHTDAQTDVGARDLADVDELGEQLERGLNLDDSPTTDSPEDSGSDDDEEGGTSLF
ncbi:hypothetical protein NCS57_00152400 [Fusarium keratoplasticum]|uniref:Uncharacterized protein n=1 Tax=Fusarium keratoplasticum TaxID=1328300 RepID=A0ACC0RGE2_9HYPO|nr:hypothetical protein NCS57_00152400 [Fusarium keratoplasticum]KAI8684852.1 hypothetical protein NCS57_00152400 [Fusarium keratoplasticum]